MYFACAFVGRLHQAGAAAGSDVAAQRTQSRGHAFDLLVRAEERVQGWMDWTAAQMLRPGFELAGAQGHQDPAVRGQRGAGQRHRPRASRALAGRPRQGHVTLEPTRTGLAADTLQRAVLDNLAYLQARYPDIATASRLVHGARLQRARPHAGALGEHGADLRRARREGRLLPLGRVPDRPATRQQPGQPRHRGERTGGDAGARPGSRRAARARRGAGPGQRRSRSAGRLLSGLAGDARGSRDRLRHPLRVRHLRSGDPRRLAGRGDRQVAAERQSMGDRAPGRELLCQLRRPHRAYRRRDATGALDPEQRRSRAWPTTRRCSATRSTPATSCGSGRARRSSRSTSRPSTSATTTAPSTRR